MLRTVELDAADTKFVHDLVIERIKRHQVYARPSEDPKLVRLVDFAERLEIAARMDACN